MTLDEDNEEAVRKSREVKNVGQRRIMIALGIVLLLSIIAAGGGSLTSYLTLRSAAQDGTVLAQQIQEQCESPESTSPDLAQFCPDADRVVESAPSEIKQDPVPGPAGPTGADGSPGTPGPAPTDAQVFLAVKSFCNSTGRCEGDDGSSATPAQVAIAVSSYCDARGDCRGGSGEDGTNGADGTDGNDAPPITQAQLIDAVDSFCSQGTNCQGPAGQDGEDGKDGSDSTVPGPPGVVNVVDNCDAAPEGQYIVNVDPSYDPDTQTVTISCSYADDEVGGLLQNGR